LSARKHRAWRYEFDHDRHDTMAAPKRMTKRPAKRAGPGESARGSPITRFTTSGSWWGTYAQTLADQFGQQERHIRVLFVKTPS
jgi:hypothetical protein